MRRVLVLVVVAWLAPAVFVAVYDPSVTREPSELESALVGRKASIPLLADGYVKRWAIESMAGEDEATATKHRVDYLAQRGNLDRVAGTFTLTVACTLESAGELEAVQLYVSDRSLDDPSIEDSWARVAESRVQRSGQAKVTLLCQAEVPASSRAYKVEEIHGGEVLGGFAQTMLTAPTFLGRTYDRIAWLPLFNWVPTIR